jgi:hypothetical protein
MLALGMNYRIEIATQKGEIHHVLDYFEKIEDAAYWAQRLGELHNAVAAEVWSGDTLIDFIKFE